MFKKRVTPSVVAQQEAQELRFKLIRVTFQVKIPCQGGGWFQVLFLNVNIVHRAYFLVNWQEAGRRPACHREPISGACADECVYFRNWHALMSAPECIGNNYATYPISSVGGT